MKTLLTTTLILFCLVGFGQEYTIDGDTILFNDDGTYSIRATFTSLGDIIGIKKIRSDTFSHAEKSLILEFMEYLKSKIN